MAHRPGLTQAWRRPRSFGTGAVSVARARRPAATRRESASSPSAGEVRRVCALGLGAAVGQFDEHDGAEDHDEGADPEEEVEEVRGIHHGTSLTVINIGSPVAGMPLLDKKLPY